MKSFTALEIFSMAHGVNEALSNVPESDLSAVDVYQMMEEDRMDDLRETGIEAWFPHEDLDDTDLLQVVQDNEYIMKSALIQYGDYIKAGLIVEAINSGLESDMNVLDMDQLATVGMNTSQDIDHEGTVARFDQLECAWIGEDGRKWNYDKNTGLPAAQV